jgi:hypothetical protein
MGDLIDHRKGAAKRPYAGTLLGSEAQQTFFHQVNAAHLPRVI